MDTFTRLIGERIKLARVAAGLSQEGNAEGVRPLIVEFLIE